MKISMNMFHKARTLILRVVFRFVPIPARDVPRTFPGRERSSLLFLRLSNWILFLGLGYTVIGGLLSLFGVPVPFPGVTRAVDSDGKRILQPIEMTATAIYNLSIPPTSTPLPVRSYPTAQFDAQNAAYKLHLTAQAVTVEPTFTPLPPIDAGGSAPAIPPADGGGGGDGMWFARSYSYYNPSFGPPNCHTANWDGYRCADTTASGLRWSDYIRRGVAMHRDDLAVMGLGIGAQIEVVSPQSIAGIYTIVDVCPDCRKDGYQWIDFLDYSCGIQSGGACRWGYPVLFRLLIDSGKN